MKLEDSNIFRMDRKVFRQFSDFNELEKLKAESNRLSPEQGILTIEFLRQQWIDMNGLSSVMDRKYFEYR